MRLRIRNGRVLDPANSVDQVTDLYVAGGRIVSLGRPPSGFHADQTLDASNRIVIPGIVDLAVRLREPGQEHKATIASETRAAAAGGVTSLCCPPDTQPVVDTPAEVKLVQQRAADAGMCRVHVLGALTQGLHGKALSEMAALREAGCIGLSNALEPLPDTLVLRRAMEYAESQRLTLHLTPLDHRLANHGCAHEGVIATRLGLPGIPEAAETAAVGQQLALVEQTGARVHFGRLSTDRALRMVARARHDGLPVTADTSIHHLFLTEADIDDYNALCHTLPPMRTLRDREALRNGIREGTLQAVCSDHQPHDPDAKCAPFAETEPGISAVETLLPLMLRLVDENAVDLASAVAKITCEPASILGIDAGTLGIGRPADVCIFEPEASWTLGPTTMLSQGKNNPMCGSELRGRACYTVLAGQVVHGPGGPADPVHD